MSWTTVAPEGVDARFEAAEARLRLEFRILVSGGSRRGGFGGVRGGTDGCLGCLDGRFKRGRTKGDDRGLKPTVSASASDRPATPRDPCTPIVALPDADANP